MSTSPLRPWNQRHDYPPMIPSKLLRIAHGDLQKARSDPALTIDMDLWAATDVDQPLEVEDSHFICKTCLAGSVMFKTLDLVPEIDIDYYPEDFPGNEAQLEALNLFRLNNTSAAFFQLGILQNPPQPQPHIPDYHEDSNTFMPALLALADHFEAHGF